jgi:tellurite resistance protein
MVRAMVTESAAGMSRALHPQRLTRALASSRNPVMKPLEAMAQNVKAARSKAPADNPFLAAEALFVQGMEQVIDFWRDSRDLAFEMTFFTVWGSPWARAFGRTHEAKRTLKTKAELRGLTEVANAIMQIEQGGFPEAVVRMLVLLADNRGTVRKDRLERSAKVLTRDEPFRSLGAERRAMIIHQQTLIATFEVERAISTLPSLLRNAGDRSLALEIVQFIVGAIDEMSPHTLSLLQRFREVLGLAPLTENVTSDPLADVDEAVETLEAMQAARPETVAARHTPSGEEH